MIESWGPKSRPWPPPIDWPEPESPPPRVALDHRYQPRVCAAPDCPLPPHVCWRIESGGALYGVYRRAGDMVDLCDVHEREVVDLCGADWGDEPTVPRQRADGADQSAF